MLICVSKEAFEHRTVFGDSLSFAASLKWTLKELQVLHFLWGWSCMIMDTTTDQCNHWKATSDELPYPLTVAVNIFFFWLLFIGFDICPSVVTSLFPACTVWILHNVGLSPRLLSFHHLCFYKFFFPCLSPSAIKPRILQIKWNETQWGSHVNLSSKKLSVPCDLHPSWASALNIAASLWVCGKHWGVKHCK